MASWTWEQHIAGLNVQFPAYATTKINCLVAEARAYKQLDQGN